MIKKIFNLIINMFSCFKKDEIKTMVKSILMDNSININHLKILRLDNKIVEHYNNFEKVFNEIYNLQLCNQNINFNLKTIYLYIYFLCFKQNDKVNNKIKNICVKNYLKIKINNSKSLKFFLLQKGLFIFLRRINERSELFLFITKNEINIKNYTLIDKISLFLKIFDINIFQIINQYLINPLNIITKDNNFKKIKDYYNLILKILRKLFKILKNNIDFFIIDIYNIPYIEAIWCYEIYSEFISTNNIINNFYEIIDEKTRLEFNIPNKLEYDFKKEENQKIEKYIYKIKQNDPKLKEISLFYYLEYSLSFFISRNIEENQLNKNQYEKFKQKNNLILNFISIKQIELKKKLKEMNSMISKTNQNHYFLTKHSIRYKNKINTLNFNKNTNKINKVNKEEDLDNTKLNH